MYRHVRDASWTLGLILVLWLHRYTHVSFEWTHCCISATVCFPTHCALNSRMLSCNKVAVAARARSSHQACWRGSLTKLPSHNVCAQRQPQVQAAACNTLFPVPSSSSFSFSSGSSRRSNVSCAAARNFYLNNMDYVDTSLEGAIDELARLAAPNTSCPAESYAAIKAACKALGGRFFAVSCGHWQEGPEVGQLARALVQTVLVVVLEPEPGVPTRYAITQDRVVNPVAVHAVGQPQDHPHAMIAHVVYPLDSNGWPTGEAYQSATAFEKLTDKKHVKKPLQSFEFWYQGRPHAKMMSYFNMYYRPYNVGLVMKEASGVVKKFTHDELTAAGVRVNVIPWSRKPKAPKVLEGPPTPTTGGAAAASQAPAGGRLDFLKKSQPDASATSRRRRTRRPT